MDISVEIFSTLLIRNESWSLCSSSLHSHYIRNFEIKLLIGQKSGTSFHWEREREWTSHDVWEDKKGNDRYRWEKRSMP